MSLIRINIIQRGLTKMFCRQNDVVVFTKDKRLAKRIKDMLEVIGIYRTIFVENDVQSIAIRPKSAVIICDMRDETDTAFIRSVSENFMDRRKYYCICILDSISSKPSFFNSANYLMLEVSASKEIFYTTFFSAVIKLNEGLEEVMYGHISEEQVENTISDMLYRIGIPFRRRGFEYLKNAIFLTVYEPKLGEYLTKNLYVILAKKFNVKDSAIERGIRLCVSYAYTHGYDKDIDELFHRWSENSYPKNSEFIPAFAKIVCHKLNISNEQYKAAEREAELEYFLRKKALEDEQKELRESGKLFDDGSNENDNT